RAAKADAAIHGKARPPLEQQAHDLQEILVPADGDAVLGNPAEPRHDPVVEPLHQACDVVDRLKGHRVPSSATPQISGGNGSILSPSIAATKWPSFIR